MVHDWECDRCTHTWTSCCFGDTGKTKEEKERSSRQLSSGLCWDCFKQLEAGEITGLELFELYYYLHKKSDKYGASTTWRVFNKGTVESPFYGPDGNTIIEKDNWESGFTAEQEQLHEIVSAVRTVYKEIIEKQRTAKRIELNEFQKTSGFVLFGPQPKPEGFIGDPPGKQRFEALFGLDPASGDIIAPTIRMNDGTK